MSSPSVLTPRRDCPSVMRVKLGQRVRLTFPPAMHEKGPGSLVVIAVTSWRTAHSSALAPHTAPAHGTYVVAHVKVHVLKHAYRAHAWHLLLEADTGKSRETFPLRSAGFPGYVHDGARYRQGARVEFTVAYDVSPAILEHRPYIFASDNVHPAPGWFR